MSHEEFFGFMGLAGRAGKLVYGTQACEKAVRTGKAELIVVDGGASANTLKTIKDSCRYYNVPLIDLEESDRLGVSTGKADYKVIGIADPDFAKAAWDKYNAGTGGESIE